MCTETAPGQESEFQTELRKVIFSHISDADRLGKETLDELIAYKTEELREQLANSPAGNCSAEHRHRPAGGQGDC